jgi:hypothetical protein
VSDNRLLVSYIFYLSLSSVNNPSDLLYKSPRGKFEAVQLDNKLGAQVKALASVAIALFEDAKVFEPADDVLHSDAQFG